MFIVDKRGGGVVMAKTKREKKKHRNKQTDRQSVQFLPKETQ